jgi:hypothetical protein
LLPVSNFSLLDGVRSSAAGMTSVMSRGRRSAKIADGMTLEFEGLKEGTQL